RKLSVHHINQKLSFVLETTLKPMNIGYRLVDGSILLHRATGDAADPVGDAGDFQGTMNAVEPQDRTVTGSVTDEKGEGLPGVSVVVKGTQRGTVTSANGAYSIGVASDADVLVFSFVGYLSQEV